MKLHARIPTAGVRATAALYRDFISSSETAIHRWLPSFVLGTPAWRDALSCTRPVDANVIASVRAFNHALGVDATLCARLDGLASGVVRAVVTGQQPGVMGGPLLSLYKAASAIALARRVEKETGHACVPVFWMGADDDDFAEVRELCLLGSDYSRVDVSVDASAYRPGLRVGDIGAPAVRAAWNAVAPVLPKGAARDGLTSDAADATDFADAAARALVAATAGNIVVVDGRANELRSAGKDMLLSFFDREPVLRDSLETTGAALVAEGYHAQIQWGADSGLFMVEKGIRQRIPNDHRDETRAVFERDITRVSPGVVARNLLQDAVLSPLAVVLGPAEIAYRAQMSGVYREMKVDMPVVVPRLSATYLPPAVRDMVVELSLDGAEIAADPGALAARVHTLSGDNGLKSASRALEAAFAREAAAFLQSAAGRLDARAQQKLEKRFDELSGRLAQTLATAVEHDTQGARARWPFLPRMLDMFVKDSDPQERFLSCLVPMLFHDADAWRAIDELATAWAGDALDGRVWHGVYSI